MNKRSLIFYCLMLLAFGIFIFLILKQGSLAGAAGNVSPRSSFSATDHSFSGYFKHNIQFSLPVLLLQILVILAVSRCFGFLFRRIGQPTVIGEIVAGIFLGPSVLGWIFPSFSNFLFPPASLSNLQLLSQLGLILFMFIIGMELDLTLVRKQALNAVVISHASILIPYALGMGLAYFLFPRFAAPGISFLNFSLFMGIAMSITAFPVLSRIIKERGMAHTPLGTMAITCAAADDITAWCILALLVALLRAGTSLQAVYAIGLVIAYVLLMVFPIRMILAKLYVTQQDPARKALMAFVFMFLLLSAYTTEIIGIHALFGAFLAGAIIPQQGNLRKNIIAKIEDLSMILLLPLFFAYTGLRTQIGMLNDTARWISCGWILLIAIAGKFGGSALAARITGQSWKDSLSIGALMNTRGLMELVVLNIGLDLGIISPAIFAMMVLMALLTTFITNPALNLINHKMR